MDAQRTPESAAAELVKIEGMLAARRAKHVQLRGRRSVEIPSLGIRVTPAPENGKPGVLIELLTLPAETA